jgi:predicted acetyltransferase
MTSASGPESLRLRAPRADDEEQVLLGQEELRADDFAFAFLAPDESWSDFVERAEMERQGIGVPPERVPSTFLLAVVGDDVVGRVSIRHRLNDHLRVEGGHIGYGIRPAFRRRGYATEVLRQSLEIVRGMGIERALVTCDDDNEVSARVIESCGGVLEDVVMTDAHGPVRRYWIDLTTS